MCMACGTVAWIAAGTRMVRGGRSCIIQEGSHIRISGLVTFLAEAGERRSRISVGITGAVSSSRCICEDKAAVFNRQHRHSIGTGTAVEQIRLDHLQVGSIAMGIVAIHALGIEAPCVYLSAVASSGHCL